MKKYLLLIEITISHKEQDPFPVPLRVAKEGKNELVIRTNEYRQSKEREQNFPSPSVFVDIVCVCGWFMGVVTDTNISLRWPSAHPGESLDCAASWLLL